VSSTTSAPAAASGDGVQPGVPLYGVQTRRAVENFAGPGRALGHCPELLRAYAQVKAAAARANVRLGVLDPHRGAAIGWACREIAEGELDGQFPSPLLTGGGGTSTNMNLNEVIAARATQLLAGRGLSVHPNDHVNASQSSNDTYPTAMALTVLAMGRAPQDALTGLAEAFDAKAAEYDGLRRLGRTCLQDAASVTAGATHRAHARAVRRVRDGLRAAVDAFLELPLGATAVGTGAGAPDGYAALAVSELAAETGLDLRPAADLPDALAHLDAYSAAASAAVRAALVLAKIAADLRLLASGPAGGLGELTLPEVQAGSSIMPGKVNPVIPEYVVQLTHRVRGCALTVDLAVAAGELEVNVMEPVITDAMTRILPDLAAAATALDRLCVRGLRWNEERVTQLAEHSYDRWIAEAVDGGYDAASARVRAARGE
jgi:aspartate ammonia-lyase